MKLQRKCSVQGSLCVARIKIRQSRKSGALGLQPVIIFCLRYQLHPRNSMGVLLLNAVYNNVTQMKYKVILFNSSVLLPIPTKYSHTIANKIFQYNFQFEIFSLLLCWYNKPKKYVLTIELLINECNDKRLVLGERERQWTVSNRLTKKCQNRMARITFEWLIILFNIYKLDKLKGSIN